MKPNKKQLLLVVHSQSGRNMQLALIAYHAAKQNPAVDVRLLRAFEAESDDMIKADALLLLTPEMNAIVSGGMKELIDRVFYPLERAGKQALPYAAVINCGNAGQSAEKQLDSMLSGIRAKKIQDTFIIHGDATEQEQAQCAALAEAMASGLEMGIF